MKITVIGAGRWGSCIAWYLDKIGHEVALYGRPSSARFIQLAETRTNGLLTFGDGIKFSCDFESACEAEIIVISVGAQNTRALARDIAKLYLEDKTFVLCMKGIEFDTGKRLSEIINEEIIQDVPSNRVAVWLGPGHVQDFANGVVGCMVIDSDLKSTKTMLINKFSSKYMRFYYGDDMVGNEIGAATKNIIGIAGGMLDAAGMTALKGALTTRGSYEVSRLIKAMGGKSSTAYGLCHLGDYAATVFSPFSQNRSFGEAFIRGETYDKLAEGYYSVAPIVMLSEKYNVQMPICRAVYDMLYKKLPLEDAINTLLTRDQKNECWS